MHYVQQINFAKRLKSLCKSSIFLKLYRFSVERSTDQVIKPLYLEALTSWYDKFPNDVASDLPKIAPMLQVLGYDPNNMRQTYGVPDQFVLNKVCCVIICCVF